MSTDTKAGEIPVAQLLFKASQQVQDRAEPLLLGDSAVVELPLTDFGLPAQTVTITIKVG